MVYPYVAKTYGAGLMYFADDGQGNLVIGNTSEFPEGRAVVPLSEWDRQKPSYNNREDILRYDDLVNAAWQNNSLRFGSLDRDSAVISKLEMGAYFPRIWRGLYSEDCFQVYNAISPRSIYGGKYIGSVVATSIIFDEMQTLFRYIEPQTRNNAAYGHKLRELLIIACTEVETLWRSVLEANSSGTKSRYNTNDYCTLIGRYSSRTIRISGSCRLFAVGIQPSRRNRWTGMRHTMPSNIIVKKTSHRLASLI